MGDELTLATCCGIHVSYTHMNFIAIDKTSPDMAEAVKGCEVGIPKTFTVTATPVSDTDSLLVATIDSVEYTEDDDSAGEEPEEAAPAEMPYKPKARAGAAMAVEQ